MRGQVVTWAAAALLGLGCNAVTDFDYDYSDDAGAGVDSGGGGGFDGGSTDGGTDDGGTPTDGDTADAGGYCPSPCYGDVVEDFRPMMQKVGAVDWRFLEDRRSATGTDYAELVWGTWGDVDGWVDPDGDGAPPAIARCSDNADQPACAGLEEMLVMASDGPEAGGDDTTIELTVSDSGAYNLAGFYRAADGMATTTPHEWIITRNSRNDVVQIIEFLPTETRESLDQTITLLGGDSVRVTLRTRPDATGSRPMGLRAWLTQDDGGLPADCLMALDFDGTDPFYDPCSDTTLSNLTDGIADPDPGPSTETTSVTPEHGNARAFVEGQYLKFEGASLDYSGDFTVQMWIKVDEATLWTTAAAYTDATTDEPSPGGVYIDIDDSDLVWFGTFYTDDSCTDGVCSVGDGASRPSDGEWHFFRLIRSTADDELRLCVDGETLGAVTVPGDRDLTSGYAPRIGRNVVFNPAYFYGAIDDVRVFSTALPCGP